MVMMLHISLNTDTKDMKDEFTYIDLGLPSGRLWATENAKGYYTYDKAKKKFGELLPSPEAFEELYEECEWIWDTENKGVTIVGPNKNTIFFPASGFRYYASGELSSVGSVGHYWSYASVSMTSVKSFGFRSGGVYPLSDAYYVTGFSVRLCKEQ